MEQPPFPPPPKKMLRRKRKKRKDKASKSCYLSINVSPTQFCQEFEVEARLVVGLAVVSL